MSGGAAARIKVPLWRSVGEAINQVFGDLKSIVRTGWLPFTILTAFSVVLQFTLVDRLGAPIALSRDGTAAGNLQTPLLFVLFEFVVLFLLVLCYNGFMVSWYRHILGAGETGRGYWAAYWRVLGYYVLLIIGFFVLVFVLALVGGIVFAVSAIVGRGHGPTGLHALLVGAIVITGTFFACFLFTRMSLVFPAAAHGKSLGFRLAWRKMRGNTWRLMAALFLVTIVSLLIEVIPGLTYNRGVIEAIMSGTTPQITPLPAPVSIVIGVFGQFALFLYFAIACSIVAIFYRELVRRSTEVAEVFA
jgi:hypothetical protein